MSLPEYERFAQVMEHLCRHDGNNGHGYSKLKRWGDGTTETITLSDGSKVIIANGDRDCSSGIISALAAIGIDVHGASYTGNMKSCLLKTGLFAWYPMSQNHPAKRGDIYLNETHHTAMCTSDNPDQLCQFSISEIGKVYGKQGDQNGRESNFRSYYNYPWNGRLCWIKRDSGIVIPTPTPNIDNPSRHKVKVDGIWGPDTTGQSQLARKTTFDKVISSQAYSDAKWMWSVSRESWEYSQDPQGSQLIANLQRLIGADPDGLAGYETAGLLQQWLVDHGYSVGSCGVDHYFGHDSVKAYQRALNDGILG